ncbi:hypothetical protein DO97_15735 [Neosynechococcus sphagnicola sy1]|uniref:SH3b domain-containing protein n=1 Tax=Neosynechococcus sphagnicola sy1 TaxID=1497020 RepID=A0A098TGL7_9CYAN|nr:SH3 domain-containing protein [Neosynechococcus sphagnicola]KGF71735.1 hypothetical protein DO97_15735 [Neosynechococcus sphagnicola sy1]
MNRWISWIGQWLGLMAIAAPAAIAAVPVEFTPASSPTQLAKQLGVAQTAQTCGSSFRQVKTPDGRSLKLRSQPHTDAKILGEIPNATQVLFNLSNRDGNWAEVTIPGGKTGWVATQFLVEHPISTQVPASLRIRTLDGGAVHVRASPIPNAKVVSTLATGTVVQFRQSIGYWTKIVAPHGISGFVDNRFLVCT